ncbi:hypothetical protein LJR225_000020 [Phenylobacterium sp. LjRoot225]|uniref:hypothetical protein n=1 Tax=Phenylobacterium sp. LjRoot225 TaxID=3342285 RepID=UPI003ECC581F
MSDLVEEQIRAYDALLLGSCASPQALRDLAALGRVLDLDLDPGASAAGLWARLRPLIVDQPTSRQ